MHARSTARPMHRFLAEFSERSFDKRCQLKLHRSHRTNTHASEQSNGCLAAATHLKHKNHFIIQELMRLPLIEQKQPKSQSHFKWKRKISSFLFSHFLLCDGCQWCCCCCISNSLPAQIETHSCECLFSRMWKTSRRRRICNIIKHLYLNVKIKQKLPDMLMVSLNVTNGVAVRATQPHKHAVYSSVAYKLNENENAMETH